MLKLIKQIMTVIALFSAMILFAGGANEHKKINFTSGIKTNTVEESTSNAGIDIKSSVNIDGVLSINSLAGNPEFKLTENGTQRAKVYYDITNNRFVFQNNESGAADALYFADPATFTAGIMVTNTVSGDAVRIRTPQTPASASATGTQGDVCWDANYIYICVSTNTWKRSAISTW